MTDIDELRDRLAALCGYKKCVRVPGLWHGGPAWPNDTCATGCADGMTTNRSHPFPPNDYNAIIAAWPEGWEWSRKTINCRMKWRAMYRGKMRWNFDDTGDEYADRLRLTVAVLEAIRP